MRLAYVDTSCFVALSLREPGYGKIKTRLESFDRLFSSNLLEAELRAVLFREDVTEHPSGLLSRLTWVYPSRPLSHEFEEVLAEGYLRGADLWHLACALLLRKRLGPLAFLTADRRQQEIAERIGLPATL